MASASASQQRVALVTGANKGIGYHIVEQLARADSSLIVLLGSRDASRGAEAAKQLNLPNVKPIEIDIDSQDSITRAAEQVKKEYGGLDYLLNNAGIAFKGDAFDENVVVTTYKTNYYGTLNAINTFLPIIRDGGRIINTSSGVVMSALTNMSAENRKRFVDPKLTIEGLTSLLEEFRAAVAKGDYAEKGYPKTAYGMSKVGVSMLTRILAKSAPRGITVNAGDPGWCKSDMAGYERPPRTAEEGARTFSKMVLVPANEYTNGECWKDEQPSIIIPECAK